MNNAMLPLQEMTSVPFPADKVYTAALRAADSLGKVKSSDRTLRRIVYTTGSSMTSWGEMLTIQIMEFMGVSQVSVTSQLKTSMGSRAYSTRLFAEKNNKKEIDNFMKALSAYL